MSKTWSTRTAAERRALEAEFVASHGAELLLAGDPEEEHAMDASIVPAPRRFPFAELYAALQRHGPLPVTVSEALRDDRRLRDDFALLLQREARQHIPRAAAAAGRGALRRREVGGRVTVRVVESHASSDQVYLLIELAQATLQRAAPSDRSGAHDGGESGRVPERNVAGAASPPEAEREDPRVDRARATSTPDTKIAAPSQLVVKTAAKTFLKRELPPPEARTIRLVMAADDPLVQAVGEPASEIYLL